jgi:hypothetical protein
MNQESIEAVCAYFDVLLPHDPLNLKEHLLPWWINLELFEEFGAKVPLGLFKNKKALEDPEEAFKFFSERMECKLVVGEHGPTIEFEGGSFRPGVVDEGDFELKSPNLTIVGSLDHEYMVFKNKEICASEASEGIDPNATEIDETSIEFIIGAYGGNVNINGENYVNINFDGTERIEYPENPNARFSFWYKERHQSPQDRLSAIQEVKKSVLWRAFK